MHSSQALTFPTTVTPAEVTWYVQRAVRMLGAERPGSARGRRTALSKRRRPLAQLLTSRQWLLPKSAPGEFFGVVPCWPPAGQRDPEERLDVFQAMKGPTPSGRLVFRLELNEPYCPRGKTLNLLDCFPTPPPPAQQALEPGLPPFLCLCAQLGPSHTPNSISAEEPKNLSRVGNFLGNNC